jgi:lipoate-protein ligase A
VSGTPAWRLLIDGPRCGAWNMALDEALLAARARGDPAAPPTLRLYAWSPPALSLGRHQPATASHDPRFLQRAGIDLVRRPTGGRAVLHDRERTFAVVGSLRSSCFPAGVIETYRRIAEALLRALGALGLQAASLPASAARHAVPDEASCFARTSAHEISVGGRKLVGSAQLRRGGAFLQHGSIPLASDPGRLAAALGRPVPADRSTDLCRALEREVDVATLDRALCEAFAECFRARLVPGEPSAEEREQAHRLQAWKYLSAAWTRDGRLGERERAWGPISAR